jgi:uncharacterized membrane protein YvbJ
MNCPNCGLAHPDNAKFCSNCGTPFGNVPSQQSSPPTNQPRYEPPPPAYGTRSPYQTPGQPQSRNPIAKNFGIGCLIAVIVLLFLGLSCTRACLGFRHGRAYMHRRY